ncbi:BrnT family toxin [Roseicella frigidaeris]|uniref:BrnT family toxin n=1 Tax=Roseicella frigidaeris TaxID=2230885 RepID=A0A327M793_9PROT|nr:BrnT family toxin [Roseicella frigidaeris]RAI55948.1 BrnT family toxin [Roseicella frigidaeris]
MLFEWDELKRQGNIEKHGFDFVDAPLLFSKPHMTGRTRDGQDGEERWIATGILRDRYATAVYTMRGETIRLISIRSARRDERQRHQALFG